MITLKCKTKLLWCHEEARYSSNYHHMLEPLTPGMAYVRIQLDYMIEMSGKLKR